MLVRIFNPLKNRYVMQCWAKAGNFSRQFKPAKALGCIKTKLKSEGS